MKTKQLTILLAIIGLLVIVTAAWMVFQRPHEVKNPVALAEPGADPGDQLKKCLKVKGIPFIVDKQGAIYVDAKDMDSAVNACS